MLDIVHILTGSDAYPPSLDALIGQYLERQKFNVETAIWSAQVVDAAGALRFLSLYESLPPALRLRFLLSPSVCKALLEYESERSFGNLNRIITLCEDEVAIFRAFDEGAREVVWSPMGDEWVERTSRGYERRVNRKLDALIAIDFDGPDAVIIDERSGTMSFPAEPFSEHEREEIASKLIAALAHIDEVAPTFGRVVRNYTRAIRIRKHLGSRGGSEQQPARIGEIHLLNPQLGECDVRVLAFSLIHESVHNLLSVYEKINGPFVLTPGGSDLRYRPVSPWSGNPIPVESFCHAVFVWFALFHFALKESREANAAFPERAAVALAEVNKCASGFMVPSALSDFLRGNDLYAPGFLGVIDDLQDIVQRAVDDEIGIGSSPEPAPVEAFSA